MSHRGVDIGPAARGLCGAAFDSRRREILKEKAQVVLISESSDPSNHKELVVKTLIAVVIATLMLASGALAAPGAGTSDFYPVGHESYTGAGQESSR